LRIDERLINANSTTTHITPRHRDWLLDARRCDAVRGSDAAFLVGVGVSLIFSGVVTYFDALWQIGPV
jgi:hypothetical protein